MDDLIYTVFICIGIPLLLSLFLLDAKAKRIVGFLIIGGFMCVFVSEINGIARNHSDQDLFYLTTNITPMTEELIKTVPILFYGCVFSDRRDRLISISIAEGIGFAIVENVFTLCQSGTAVGILWAVKRAFGASLMHGICTANVGLGISLIRKRKKLFFFGTFALLQAAMLYHAVYNALIQSSCPNLGYFMPVITYIPVIYVIYKMKKNKTARSRAVSVQPSAQQTDTTA